MSNDAPQGTGNTPATNSAESNGQINDGSTEAVSEKARPRGGADGRAEDRAGHGPRPTETNGDQPDNSAVSGDVATPGIDSNAEAIRKAIQNNGGDVYDGPKSGAVEHPHDGADDGNESLLSRLRGLLSLPSWCAKRGEGGEKGKTEHPTTSLPFDAALTVIENKRRRRTLCELADNDALQLGELSVNVAAIENEVSPGEVTSKQRKRVYVGLVQAHKQQLEAANLVIWHEQEDCGCGKPKEECVHNLIEPGPELPGLVAMVREVQKYTGGGSA